MATTYNPADKNAAITLTGGNLVATGNSASNGGVRGTTSHASGKVMLSFTNVNLSGNSLDYVGVGIAADTLGLASGSQIQVIVIDSGTAFTGDGSAASTFPDFGTLSTNCTIDLCLDLGAQLFWFRINGGNWNNFAPDDPATGTGGHAIRSPGTFLPYVRLTTATSTATLNPSPASPPAGFTAWDVVVLTAPTAYAQVIS